MKKSALLLLVLLLTAAPAFAQKSFDMRYNEAVEFYTTKQYDKAIKVLEASKKSPGVTKDQITKANKLLNQCKAAKTRQSTLKLSKNDVYMPGTRHTDSLYVTAGKAWEVASHPDWINVRRELDVLYIEAEPNPLKETRTGHVEVSMGKDGTDYVTVIQEKHQDVFRPVRIHTVPERALVYVDNESGALSENFIMSEGNHVVRIEKDGFERKDTTIVVNPEGEDAENEYTFPLVPEFGTITIAILAEEGFGFDANPTVDINGNAVNLHPADIHSFNSDAKIKYYELYDGGVIPLRPGQYKIKAASEGFSPKVSEISLSKGEQENVSIILEPICGYLSVADQEYAMGAKVFMDGKEIGAVPVSHMRVKSGKHALKFVKEGFLTAEEEIDIQEGKELTVKALLHRYVTYSISSNPDYCKVYLDGKYLGSTPIDVHITEGEHRLRYEKADYFPLEETVRTDFSNTQVSKQVRLSKAYPLLVTADKDSLGITIWKGNGADRTVFAENVKTPARVNIPLSDTPYQIELMRNNLKTAYKGRIKFNDESKNLVNILTWGDEPPMLGVTLTPDFFSKEKYLGKGYFRLGEARVSTFKIFPGLSSSVAKAAFFWENNQSELFDFGAKQVSDIEGNTYNVDAMKIDGPAILPAITLLLINEEFRVGGGISQHLDANALVTYAWYPNLSKIFSFSHMSGHEVFLGAELNSRMPIFNGHFRLGVEGFFGQANLYRTGYSISNAEIKKEQFYEAAKINNPIRFVVGIGFTIGGKEAKGQNILRVF